MKGVIDREREKNRIIVPKKEEKYQGKKIKQVLDGEKKKK